MEFAQVLATESGVSLPSGGEIFYWLLGAVVIVALWWMIRQTRMRAYRDYFERRKAEEERRLNDPDMNWPDEGE